MIRVPAKVHRTFGLAVRAEEAFALMRDVPRWGRLFPHTDAIDGLEEHGPNVWRWTMEPLGPPGGRVRTVYACRYVFDADALTVRWTPVPDVGNASFRGHVSLSPRQPDQTRGSLELQAVLEIPAPRFVAGIVRATLAVEFGRMTDLFLKRLAKDVRNL